MIKFFQTVSQTYKNQPLKVSYWGELSGTDLGLRDQSGNLLTFYKADYEKFIKIIKKMGLDPLQLAQETLIQIVKEHNKEALPANQIQMVTYFSPDAVKNFELAPLVSDFSKEGRIVTQNGTALKKEGHQNCLVMLHDGSIYTHPKVRANMQADVMGINHSSLTQGKKTIFAGSLVHDAQKGWVIENTTGHYGTRATQMRQFLVNLQQKMVPIEELTVKLWIPKDPSNPGIAESEYNIIEENASDFLKRTSSSIKKIDDEGYESRGPSPGI